MLQITGLVAIGLLFQLGVVAPQAHSTSASVDCGNDGSDITITISGVPFVSRWTEEDWRLNSASNMNPRCLPSSFSGNTVQYTLNGSDCDDVDSRQNEFVYTFVITAAQSGNNPINVYDHHYTITCKYNRDGTVQSSFIPIHRLRANDTDTEDLVFNVRLYDSAAYDSELSGTVNLGTTIYARLKVNHQFAESLDIRLDHCYTTTDQAGDSNPYDLIMNSCTVPGVANVNYDCAGQTDEEEDFSFEAYRFPTQNNGDKVWLHFDVYACVSDPSSLCVSQCAVCSGPPRVRKRRDSDQITNERFQLTTGPYKFVDAGAGLKDTTKEQEDQPATPTNMILILSVSGVVAIAVVCVIVLIVLRKRRQNIHFTKSSDMALETPAREASETSMKI